MSESFNPFEAPELNPPLNEEWEAKRRIGALLRELTESLVTSTASAEELNELAEVLSELSEKFNKSSKLCGRNAFADVDEGRRHGDRSYLGYETNPVAGLSNPIAPPLNIWIEGDTAHGSAELGWSYEGPPGCIHGGWVAALFDQFLGVSQTLTKQPGVTGTLAIKYLKPTPLCTELKLIGRVVSVEGRKNKIFGEMWAGEVLTATCEGLFIAISKERFIQLASESRK